MTFMMPGMMLVMYGVTLMIVWVSAHRIDSGTLQVGAMTAFITYSMQIVMSSELTNVASVGTSVNHTNQGKEEGCHKTV